MIDANYSLKSTSNDKFLIKFPWHFNYVMLVFHLNEILYEIVILLKDIHTYIIGHYNPSVRIIDLVSHTTYVVCFLWSLKSTPNDRFFEKLFIAILFTLRAFARNLMRGNRQRNTFCISFWCLAWNLNPGFSSNKPTHYLLDYGDFSLKILIFNFNYNRNFTKVQCY